MQCRASRPGRTSRQVCVDCAPWQGSGSASLQCRIGDEDVAQVVTAARSPLLLSARRWQYTPAKTHSFCPCLGALVLLWLRCARHHPPFACSTFNCTLPSPWPVIVVGIGLRPFVLHTGTHTAHPSPCAHCVGWRGIVIYCVPTIGLTPLCCSGWGCVQSASTSVLSAAFGVAGRGSWAGFTGQGFVRVLLGLEMSKLLLPDSLFTAKRHCLRPASQTRRQILFVIKSIKCCSENLMGFYSNPGQTALLHHPVRTLQQLGVSTDSRDAG